MTNWSCNYACKFCFLGEKRHSKAVINIAKLKEQLREISQCYDISSIQVYGGETSLLGIRFFQQLYAVLFRYAKVSLITNFSDPLFCEEAYKIGASIGVSLNNERNHAGETLQAILCSDIPASISCVVTPSILKADIKTLLDKCETLERGIGFIQYSKSESNPFAWNISNRDYADFLVRLIEAYRTGGYTFPLENDLQLKDTIEEKYAPSMRGLLFIDPYNRYASIRYDDEQRESFQTYKSLSEWESACLDEDRRYWERCAGCRYYGHCLAEHLHSWQEGDECCGMKGVLEHFEGIHQNDGDVQPPMQALLHR